MLDCFDLHLLYLVAPGGKERDALASTSSSFLDLRADSCRKKAHFKGWLGKCPQSIAVMWAQNSLTHVQLAGWISESYTAGFVQFVSSGVLDAQILSLDISGNSLGDEPIQVVCGVLESNKVLKTLCVSGNMISVSCVPFISRMLKVNEALTSLDLSRNMLCGVDEDGIGQYRDVEIIEMFRSIGRDSPLESLDVSYNNIGGKVLREVMDTLKRRAIVNIGVSGSNVQAPALVNEFFRCCALCKPSLIKFCSVVPRIELDSEQLRADFLSDLRSLLASHAVHIDMRGSMGHWYVQFVRDQLALEISRQLVMV
jgi:Ran GTPase-activating protein (RanGAP) involved in mRNA processing and transport